MSPGRILIRKISTICARVCQSLFITAHKLRAIVELTAIVIITENHVEHAIAYVFLQSADVIIATVYIRLAGLRGDVANVYFQGAAGMDRAKQILNEQIW